MRKLPGVTETSLPHDADISEEDFSTAETHRQATYHRRPVSPRVRVRSERLLSSVSDNHLLITLYTPRLQHPYPSLVGLSTPFTLPRGSVPPPSHQHHSPSLQFPNGKLSALLTAAKDAKGLSTRQCATSNAIPLPANVPTPPPTWCHRHTLSQWFRHSR
jgi:hypothetical protein